MMGFYGWVIILVMTIMGILGGIINYLINHNITNHQESKKREMIQTVIVGVGASFLVPLFLNMISSNLLQEAEGNFTKIMVFAGFCLIAAIASKSFINSIAERVLKQAQEAKEQANKAEEIAQAVRAHIDPLLANATEPEAADKRVIDEEIHFGADDPEAIKILKALANGRYAYRTLDGIIRATKISTERVHQVLSAIIAKGWVSQVMIESGLKFYITEQGRQELHTYGGPPRAIDSSEPGISL